MTDLAQINAVISGLLMAHQQPLQVKHVHDERTLRRILCCDFEKVLHSLVDVQTIVVDKLLRDTFFTEQPAIAEAVLAHVTSHRLSHVGFEIFEPLDLVLQGVDYWIQRLNKNLGQRIKISNIFRFPASMAFQTRVQAATEIMTIWLQVDADMFALELFDIAHPLTTVPHADSRMIYHLNPHTLLTQGWVSKQHRQAMHYWFQGDTIWHYSIHIDTNQAVEELHKQFQDLTAHTSQYRLAYAVPVANKHDKSYHTKIINLTNGLELECCHYN